MCERMRDFVYVWCLRAGISRSTGRTLEPRVWRRRPISTTSAPPPFSLSPFTSPSPFGFPRASPDLLTCCPAALLPWCQQLLWELWFSPYRRFKANDSCGFEHVFVGEESRGKITGLHNWVCLLSCVALPLPSWCQERREERGWRAEAGAWVCIRAYGRVVCVCRCSTISKKPRGTSIIRGGGGRQDRDKTDDVHLVTVRFAWDGDGDADVEIKPLSSFLCGRSSPALSPRAPLDLDAFVFRGVGQGHAGGWCWA